jgi:hypothetical protein
MDEKTITIELKLPLPALNFIMGLLGKQPFEQVADLIQGIREQAMPQLPMPEVPQAEQVQ